MTALWLTTVALLLLLVALNPSDQTTRQAGLTAHLLTRPLLTPPQGEGKMRKRPLLTPLKGRNKMRKGVLCRIVEKISNRNPYMDGVINTRHERMTALDIMLVLQLVN